MNVAMTRRRWHRLVVVYGRFVAVKDGVLFLLCNDLLLLLRRILFSVLSDMVFCRVMRRFTRGAPLWSWSLRLADGNGTSNRTSKEDRRADYRRNGAEQKATTGLGS